MQHDHEQRPARALGRIQHRILGTIRRALGPVGIVTIHHEGAGSPTDSPRGADGGYSDWIGETVRTYLRNVWISFATLRYNHRSLDICINADRDVFSLTDRHIALIHEAFMDHHARGEVIDTPLVRAHHFSPGSNTICPGTHVWPPPDVWARIVAACRYHSTPPEDDLKPTDIISAAATVSAKTLVLTAGGKVTGSGAHGDLTTETPPAVVVMHRNDAVCILAEEDGEGYWIACRDGTIHAKNGAPFNGIFRGITVGNPLLELASIVRAGDPKVGYKGIRGDGALIAPTK